MTDLFKKILKEEESLFKDQLVLDYEYMPPDVKGREKEKEFIAICLKPLFFNKTGKNIFIYGLPGIGKTVSCRHVLQELKKETDEIKPVYVNCWKKNSAHKVVLEICNQVGYKFIANRTTEELIDKISRILNKNASVIILDECDKLKKDVDFLYTLIEDLTKKSIILLTNNKEWLDTLDSRIKSRLILEELEFLPYNMQETLNILTQRANYAFFPNVIGEEALELIAEKAYEAQDVRSGIYLLKESGDIAEFDASREINKEHAQKAIDKLNKLNVRSDRIENKDGKILKIIKENNNKTTSEIHKIYGDDISYKTFLRRLKDLEKNHLVELVEENKGEGKRTRVKIKEFKTINEF
jgi:archaeal cell division control protein 6